MTIRPHMFSRIFDFRYQRTPLQAVGFYLAQLMIFFLLSSLFIALLQLVGVIEPIKAISPGVIDQFELHKLQSVISIVNPLMWLVHSVTMAIFMLKAKNMEHSHKHVLLGALAVVLGGIATPLFSLIVVAYLSTKPVAPAPVK